MFKLTFMSLK